MKKIILFALAMGLMACGGNMSSASSSSSSSSSSISHTSSGVATGSVDLDSVSVQSSSGMRILPEQKSLN